ncbi:hypothetical protein HDU82_000888 [Entophlyctis luteolus]|nr:hypothetical protein HDU82_000888 [Entophlyctis luteolus]
MPAAELAGASVIDLGSGTGIVGIACALLGADSCLLTDIDCPAVLDLLRANASSNLLAQTLSAPPGAGSDRLASTPAPISVCALEWACAPVVLPAEALRRVPFDVVVGADVVYSMESVRLLVDTIDALCGPKTDVWIAHEHRDPAVSEEFLGLMKVKNFRCKIIKQKKPSVDIEQSADVEGLDNTDTSLVAIYRFRKKR